MVVVEVPGRPLVLAVGRLLVVGLTAVGRVAEPVVVVVGRPETLPAVTLLVVVGRPPLIEPAVLLPFFWTLPLPLLPPLIEPAVPLLPCLTLAT